MVYPLVGASIDRVGFLPTFRFIAFLGFGAILVVLLTRKGLQKTTDTPVQAPSS